jgi:hypothetical protein
MSQHDPLQDLGRELSFAPSPEFAARVRRHIAAAPVTTAPWPLYRMAAAAAVVIAASVTMARVGRHTPVEMPPAPDMTLAPLTTPAPVDVRQPHRSATRQTAAPEAPLVVQAAPFAEVLVPDDQRLALEQLLGSIRAGRATVPELIVDDVVDDDGRRMPRALVIEPLRLQQLAGTPAEPIKDPIK